MDPSSSISGSKPVSLSPALNRLKSLLHRIIRVTITDGRIFIGSFAGTDQPLNILLINTEEYRVGLEQTSDGRYVGQVVIPWGLISKVESQGGKDQENVGRPLKEMYL